MVAPISVELEPFTQPAIAEPSRGTLARQVSSALFREVAAPVWPDVNLAPPRPAKVKLGFLRDGRLRVKEPIEAVVFETEGFIVAEAEELFECGDGINQSEAIADLQYAIADLYFTLEEEQDHLGKGMQQVWQVLQGKVERR